MLQAKPVDGRIWCRTAMFKKLALQFIACLCLQCFCERNDWCFTSCFRTCFLLYSICWCTSVNWARHMRHMWGTRYDELQEEWKTYLFHFFGVLYRVSKGFKVLDRKCFRSWKGKEDASTLCDAMLYVLILMFLRWMINTYLHELDIQISAADFLVKAGLLHVIYKSWTILHPRSMPEKSDLSARRKRSNMYKSTLDALQH